MGRSTNLSRAALSVSALLLCSVSSPPRQVDPAVATGPLGMLQDSAQLTAFDGGYLAFWEDGRHTPYNPMLNTVVTAYGARITAAGAMLDPGGLRVSGQPFDQSDSAAACAGAKCLVIWQQGAQGTFCRLFDPATAQWGAETMLSQPGGNVLARYQVPRVVAIGGRYFVFWDDDAGLLLRIVDAGGVPVGVALPAETMFSHDDLRAVANAAAALVVWYDAGVLYGLMFDPSGTPIGSLLTFGPARSGDLAALAAKPDGFLAVWRNAAATLNMRRVSIAATFVDAAPVTALGNVAASDQAALFDGADYVVGYTDTQINLARLDAATLATVGSIQHVASNIANPYALRFSEPLNGQALTLWSESAPFAPPTLSMGLLSIGATGSPALTKVPFSQVRADAHLAASAARLGEGFAVGWTDVRGGAFLPMVRAFDREGQPLAAPVQLDMTTQDSQGVDLAWDAVTGETRVVWAGLATLYVSTLWATGLSSPPQPINGGAFFPRLASQGGRSLLVWEIANGSGGTVLARFWEPDAGLAPGTATLFSSGSDRVPALAVAASSTQFAAVWAVPSVPPQIVFGFVTATGLGGSVVLPSGTVDPTGVSLASDGTSFFAAWNADDLTPARGVRIAPTGALLDPGGITLSAPETATPGVDLTAPQVVFDGRSYIVAWTERVADGGGFEVYRRRVDTDGGVGAVELIAGGAGEQHSPALAVGAPGRLLEAWIDSDDSAEDVTRTWSRVSAELPPGEPCAMTPQCSSGVCSALGVCCDPADGGCGDAGVLDAGVPDAGGDGGVPADAGLDAGNDAGVSSPRILEVGCGCNSSGALGVARAAVGEAKKAQRPRSLLSSLRS